MAGMKLYDMHCDVIRKLWREQKQGFTTDLLENTHHVDLKRMQQSGYGLQCFAVYVNQQEDDSTIFSAQEQIDIFFTQMEKHQHLISQVFRYEDLKRNETQGRMSALLTIEGGEACGGNLSVLRNYYRLGVRLMTQTWNCENELGFPNINLLDENCTYPFRADTKNGLKEKGIEFVEEMEQLGMIIDVSHLSDAGFYDVAEHTKKPFVATHSNAREEASFVRNLTDDMIKCIGQRGGVIGINYCADFLRDFKPGEETYSAVFDMIRHIRHIVEVGGMDVIGLGSDFDGIDGKLEIADCGRMEVLREALQKAGFSSTEQDKIFYGNVERILQELL